MTRKSRAAQDPGTTEHVSVGRRQLCVVFGVAAVFAFIAWSIPSVDRSRDTDPDRLVELYRAHHCQCVYGYEKSLEKQGYVVQIHDAGSLAFIRYSLKTPKTLVGCHVGKYLGYFVEGHVSEAGLKRLSKEQPPALGISTQQTTLAKAEHVAPGQDAGSGALVYYGTGAVSKW